MMSRSVIGLAVSSLYTGVEAAWARVDGQGMSLRLRSVHGVAEPFRHELVQAFQDLGREQQTEIGRISILDRVTSEVLAQAAHRVADAARCSLQEVLCIGCAGPLLWHEAAGRWPAAFVLGDPAVVAERTGVTTIDAFADRDRAAGGQGVVAALVDQLLFQNNSEGRLIIHLGGLTHAVYVPPAESPLSTLGWQLGPGTLLLDGLIEALTPGKRHSDHGAHQAVQGRQIPELIDRWKKQPFLLRRPPRSLNPATFGRGLIEHTLALAKEKGWTAYDLLCTATHFVAWCIGNGLNRMIPKPCRVDRVFVSGSGVKNGFLWQLLQDHWDDVAMERTDAAGVAAERKEALDAALLACLTLDGVAANLPAVTGATGSRILGRITPGSALNWRRCRAWMVGDVGDIEIEEDD